eukprot:144715_1
MPDSHSRVIPVVAGVPTPNGSSTAIEKILGKFAAQTAQTLGYSSNLWQTVKNRVTSTMQYDSLVSDIQKCNEMSKYFLHPSAPNSLKFTLFSRFESTTVRHLFWRFPSVFCVRVSVTSHSDCIASGIHDDQFKSTSNSENEESKSNCADESTTQGLSEVVTQYRLSLRQFYYLVLFMDDNLPLCCNLLEPPQSSVHRSRAGSQSQIIHPTGDSATVTSHLPGADECSICLDRRPTVCLPCAHDFCDHCITQWRAISPTCPVCRRELRVARVQDQVDDWELTVSDERSFEEYVQSLRQWPFDYVSQFPVF